jgi:NDP-sugar pyrophosphorylase family protein
VDSVVFCIGHLGDLLRDHVGDAGRFGLRASYVDEGEDLRGTAGALRLAADRGALEEQFLVTYGDSYLPVDFGAMARAFELSGTPAMMSVYRNEGRWDKSNAAVLDGRVILYEKRRQGMTGICLDYIDYGLLALRRSVVEEHVEAGTRADLADLFHDLSISDQLAAYEVNTRFYEIGSPEGLTDLQKFLLP